MSPSEKDKIREHNSTKTFLKGLLRVITHAVKVLTRLPKQAQVSIEHIRKRGFILSGMVSQSDICLETGHWPIQTDGLVELDWGSCRDPIC